MKTMTLPQKMVERMLKVTIAFEGIHDELEDYLIAHQPKLVKKLRQARREHLQGKTHPFIGLR